MLSKREKRDKGQYVWEWEKVFFPKKGSLFLDREKLQFFFKKN